MSTSQAALDGIRVIEIADERAEYAGLLLAGLGADVIKVEPPQGNPTRRIGPFYADEPGPERSLHFWHYNRGKRSVVCDLDDPAGIAVLDDLLAGADVLLDATDRGHLDARGFGRDTLGRRHPQLVVARVTPFGDDGPWADFRGSDLVHLALGGVTMNCGYDPRPDGTYDLPPIAPQMWHAYHIAGEQVVMGVLAALFHRGRTGQGQALSCAVHEAVAKNTELDLMNWVMRRLPLLRQTCRHANETVSTSPTIQQTKDGRWILTMLMGGRDRAALAGFVERHGMSSPLTVEEDTTESARQIPGSGGLDAEVAARLMDVVARLVRKFTYAEFPWNEAQDAGVFCSPLRRPEENVTDPHWMARQTFAEVEHPELGRSFTYVTSKWLSTATSWRIGRRAPLLGEDTDAVLASRSDAVRQRPTPTDVSAASSGPRRSRYGRPFALDGIRILDFSWFLASAGGTRFLSAFGAECIKVEWAAHPDTRMGAMAPVGGRRAREVATAPLPGVDDADMGGQFNNKNAGKLGISLNVRHPEGLAIARRLVAMSDVVAEGFSPGVMDRWGLGYEALKEIKPDIIYAQQSGMGAHGTYGRLRAVGPIAAAFSGVSEMSGLPSPAMPAGWGYSYLDWIGAYSFATAILSALVHRQRTGEGQWIDASQTESGIFTSGTSILDWTANGRASQRTGNRSPNKPAAPHGIYRCAGTDEWIAIACGDDDQWEALASVADRPEWLADDRFSTLAARVEAQDVLDALVTAWTEQHERYDLMERLQRAGVPAGVCQTAADRCESDPQLAHLEWLTEVTGTKIGRWPVAAVPVKLETTPADIGGVPDRGAPIYGEDNEFVYGELLGFSKREIARLAEEHVI
ncbi:CaiB/BaiF CoA-transferase family protein [Desertimonas flava]|uniref:CaiB/BaiF CoA-transferase family protein n=3 Tax=Desertimonas flava TaxID=2064846 RepID=UPI0013C40054|nr:CoA transferase [Desertimonas flava]